MHPYQVAEARLAGAGGILVIVRMLSREQLDALREAHPGLVAMEDFPALAAHCARLEALPVFTAISQPFIAPA